jgi:uncharacterized protein DUF1707/uncharacterized protein DUF4333
MVPLRIGGLIGGTMCRRGGFNARPVDMPAVLRLSGREIGVRLMQPGWPYEDPTRANDAERADVCAILDSAYSDGELDADEHRQRCATAMSAKTRGQLLGLLTDLQTRTPAFAQRPASAATVSSNRNWFIAVGAAASVLAVVALVSLITLWHHDSSPSPTVPVAAPTAALAAPTAAVAAPTETFSSDATGTYLPMVDVVGTVSGDFQDDVGHPPEHVNCPGDLDGRVGAFERCSLTDSGKSYTADVTVTAVNGNRITTHESLDEVVPPGAPGSPQAPGPPPPGPPPGGP